MLELVKTGRNPKKLLRANEFTICNLMWFHEEEKKNILCNYISVVLWILTCTFLVERHGS